MFEAWLSRFNEFTKTIQAVAFWLHLFFWLLIAIGIGSGFLGVTTQSWLRSHLATAAQAAGEAVRPFGAAQVSPIKPEPPWPVTIIVDR